MRAIRLLAEEAFSKGSDQRKRSVAGPTSFKSTDRRERQDNNLRNFSVLLKEIQLVYRPHYFMDYHCFSQHTVAGNSVILESRGKIVVDAVNGQIVDCRTSGGQTPYLPRTGAYVACSQVETQSSPSSDLPSKLPLSVIRHELDSARAKDKAKIELVKNLTLQHHYETNYGREGHKSKKERH